QLLMYASAVIYPISMASGRVREVLLWNPFVHIIEAFKYAYLGKGLLTLSGMTYTTLLMVGVMIVGVVIFNRTERNFMDTV
ncbi:MAG: ABC transporter permease, partial [Planctomycetaceae bacterium]|nr:ABC transporter permease [Planctomycetaceae bacterium]